MTIVILSLRGFTAVLVLTTLVGGVPRVAQGALAVALGLWSGLLVATTHPVAPTWVAGLHEVTLGASLGVLAAIPLLAAISAGRLVDVAASGRTHGPYGLVFDVLTAAVFVGIDGHVAVLTAIVESHERIATLPREGVLAAIGQLVPHAVRLAVPWLVTVAVVQIAVGVGMRLAGRAAVHVPSAAAVPAALVMMTAALVGTLAVAIAALVRGAI